MEKCSNELMSTFGLWGEPIRTVEKIESNRTCNNKDHMWKRVYGKLRWM